MEKATHLSPKKNRHPQIHAPILRIRSGGSRAAPLYSKPSPGFDLSRPLRDQIVNFGRATFPSIYVFESLHHQFVALLVPSILLCFVTLSYPYCAVRPASRSL